MHAVLLVSARHLLYLSPNSSEYHQASLFHLSRVLPRYRREVTRSLSAENADSVMATNFLLLYFIWSDVYAFDIKDPSCLADDRLFAMTPGIRETFISATFLLTSGQSIFSECTAYHPKYAIDKTAKQCSRVPSQFEHFFCHTYQKQGGSGAMEIREDSAQNIPRFADIHIASGKMDHRHLWHAVTQHHDPSLIGFLDAAVRLAPLSSIASGPQTQCQGSHPCITCAPNEEPHCNVLPGSSLPTADLARYVFSWPVVCSPGVLILLAGKDERMIFLLQYINSTI
jgi:hypothetical protein